MIQEVSQTGDMKSSDQKPIDFKNLPGLDYEKGLEVFDGEMEDYMSALQSFIKNAPATIDKLRSHLTGSVSANNLAEYAIDVHGLKSISGWICAQSIREGAAELEALAKAGDLASVTARNDAFLNDAAAFLNELKAALENIQEK